MTSSLEVLEMTLSLRVTMSFLELDGADILRGDMVEAGDAAITAFDAAATQFNADNPQNSITFTEDSLSIENGTAAEAGNDVILR